MFTAFLLYIFFSCCIAIIRLFLVVPYLFYKLILNVFLPALIM